MSDLKEGWSILNEKEWTRVHRTMLAVYIDAVNSNEYTERYYRFISSLNRNDTIKTDVFLVFDCDLFFIHGDFRTTHIDDFLNYYVDCSTLTNRRSHKSLKQFAHSKGYIQLAILESCENEWT